MTVYTRALIIGTGFSGLGMGIALQKQGVDFLILEGRRGRWHLAGQHVSGAA